MESRTVQWHLDIEEAAAQGLLIAGINAARHILGQAEVTFVARSTSYIGTLIDDLVTKGCSDPYRKDDIKEVNFALAFYGRITLTSG